MADLPAICAQLRQIRQDLIGSEVFVSGRPDEKEKADRESVFLETMARRLDVLMRELNSIEASLRSRQKQLWNVSRDQRHSAGQSLKQQHSNVEEAYQLALSLANTVKDLLDRNGLLNPIQKAENILKLGEDFEKQLHSEVNLIASHALHAYIQPPTAEGAHLDAHGVSALIAFTMLAVQYLKKRRSGKK